MKCIAIDTFSIHLQSVWYRWKTEGCDFMKIILPCCLGQTQGSAKVHDPGKINTLERIWVPKLFSKIPKSIFLFLWYFYHFESIWTQKNRKKKFRQTNSETNFVKNGTNFTRKSRIVPTFLKIKIKFRREKFSKFNSKQKCRTKFSFKKCLYEIFNYNLNFETYT